MCIGGRIFRMPVKRNRLTVIKNPSLAYLEQGVLEKKSRQTLSEGYAKYQLCRHF